MWGRPATASLILLIIVCCPVRAEDVASPALRLQSGSVARHAIVAVGRDLIVAGDALSDAAAINGNARVLGSVKGDLIVLGGDAELASTARVEGDIFILGGSLDAADGARIDGRATAYPSVPSAWLTLLEGPSIGLSVFSSPVLAAKLALLTAWMVVLMSLFATSGGEMLSTAESVRIDPFRNFVVGLTAVLTIVLTILFFSSFASALVGVPLIVLMAVVALVLKLWGMVAVFHALGAGVGRRVLGRHLSALTAATTGLVVLGIVKFVPWIGVWTWNVATLIGVGAALTTKLGRNEPWFEDADIQHLAQP